MDYQKFNRTNVIIELIGCAAAAGRSPLSTNCTKMTPKKRKNCS